MGVSELSLPAQCAALIAFYTGCANTYAGANGLTSPHRLPDAARSSMPAVATVQTSQILRSESVGVGRKIEIVTPGLDFSILHFEYANDRQIDSFVTDTRSVDALGDHLVTG